MDRIEITGIEAVGHHGVLEHEREFGQRFVVDISLGVDLATAGATDRLEDTVDYAALVERAVALLTGTPVRLLEHLAERIAADCLDDPRVRDVAVTVHKPAAPVSALVRDVAVRVERHR